MNCFVKSKRPLVEIEERNLVNDPITVNWRRKKNSCISEPGEKFGDIIYKKVNRILNADYDRDNFRREKQVLMHFEIFFFSVPISHIKR